jgi:UDP-N-acetylglucosamine 2-epimerase (non-hydrolysing)
LRSTTPSSLETISQAAVNPRDAANGISPKKIAVPRPKVLVLFGTRPEVIKLAPVVRELRNSRRFQTAVVSSGQHADLIKPFVELFNVKIDHDLQIMSANQTLNSICSTAVTALDKILELEKPDVILVQGDTTTALAGAMAAFNRRIAVGHVEAGLRSGNAHSPFPEEMNRRLISQLTAFHFAATEHNRTTLLAEGANPKQIFVTGNPVVDALKFVLRNAQKSARIETLIKQTKGLKLILLTTHRRESFGAAMRENLLVLREFVEKHKDTALFFPVHPNPSVRQAVAATLPAHERIFLLEPLDYKDFVALMKRAWLIVSDSGGVQEEAPSLGKPLLILRENTERPEAVISGTAKIVGGEAAKLKEMLAENYANDAWINSIKQIPNPFGDGTAAQKIVTTLAAVYAAPQITV